MRFKKRGVEFSAGNIIMALIILVIIAVIMIMALKGPSSILSVAP